MNGGRGAVFLDRDGVINVPPKKRYITSWNEFRFLPGALAALRRLRRAGRTVVILSNQAGVGRGIFSAPALREITRRMQERIRRSGGSIRAVYYCTHAPAARCPCRKPKTGLLHAAARRHKINLARSFVVGDNATDIRMGRAAGCRTVLILTGVTTRSAARRLTEPPDRIARDLPETVRWILREPLEGRPLLPGTFLREKCPSQKRSAL